VSRLTPNSSSSTVAASVTPSPSQPPVPRAQANFAILELALLARQYPTATVHMTRVEVSADTPE